MQFIYKGTKFRQSGTTMQKMKPAGEMARRAAVRCVYSGFPARPFQTEEDVEAYASGDTICCLMCGRHFVKLAIHLNAVHDMDSKEYRARFNIPAACPLVGRDARERARAHGLRPENVARFRNVGKTMKTTGYRPAVPLARARSLDAARKSHKENGQERGNNGQFVALSAKHA